MAGYDDKKNKDTAAGSQDAVKSERDFEKELEAVQKELASEKAKNKKQVKVVVPKEQQGLPKSMQDGALKTTVTKMGEYLSEKIDQWRDMATLEIHLDPSVRLMKRLQTIKKRGSAESLKINGMWKTIPPEIHTCKLQGKKVANDEYELSFGVYEVDEKNNKKLYQNYADKILPNGEIIKVVASAEYRVAYEVRETIKRGKPITREIIHVDGVGRGI